MSVERYKPRRDKKGSVALMTGLMAPAFLGVLGLGIDVSYWEMVKIELQRTADIAALAGAINYAQTNNDQGSAIMAAFVAEQNGITGVISRTWKPASRTLSDQSRSGTDLVTVSRPYGVKLATDPAFQVTVAQPVPLIFSRLFLSQTNPTVTAVATAEVGSALGTPQPCILALAGDGTAVTSGEDISLAGTANINLDHCTLRSDAGIEIKGTASVTAQSGIYAAGMVTTVGNGTINNSPLFPNAGQIPDPYAQDVAVQAAFAQLGSDGQSNSSGTLNPGTYLGLDFRSSSTALLNPGLYIVNGPINFEGGATVTGTGVTIVSNGDIAMNGNAQINLSAGSDATGGAIPGVLYANPSGAALKLNGTSTENLSGVFYAPNSKVTINGDTSNIGHEECLEVIAANVDIEGNANLTSNCPALSSAIPFGSLPGAVTLVQ